MTTSELVIHICQTTSKQALLTLNFTGVPTLVVPAVSSALRQYITSVQMLHYWSSVSYHFLTYELPHREAKLNTCQHMFQSCRPNAHQMDESLESFFFSGLFFLKPY